MLDKLMYKILGGVAFARRKGATVGEGCRILTSRFGSEPWLISIGSRVTVSSDVVFVNHDGSGWLVSDEKGRRYRYARISVGDGCFIGAGSIIMPGVRIGSRCVIGAGSVVTKSIPSGSVVAGNPAKYICEYEDFVDKVRGWRGEVEMSGETRRQRVDSILEEGYKMELRKGVSDVR